MPREDYKDVHFDRPLTNISMAYFQDQSNFVSGRMFPIVPVMKASDTFDIYPQGYWNRIYETAREEESVANSITYKVQRGSYSVGDDALRIFISDKKRKNVDVQRKLDMEATMLVTQAIILGKEQVFADTFLKAGSWTTARAGVASGHVAGTSVVQWSKDASNPIEDVRQLCLEVFKVSGGRSPNVLLMTYDVWNILMDHPDFIDRIKYQGTNSKPGMVTKQAVASLFEIDEVHVFKALSNNAVAGVVDSEGNPPVDNEFLTSKTVMLCHRPKSVGLMTPCSGLTFAWNQYISHSAMAGPSIRRYRPMDGRKGEYIEAELAIEQKQVSKDMGAIFTNIIE